MTRAIDHRCVENIRQGCRIAGPSVAGVASVFQEGSRKGKFLKLQLRKTVVDVNSGYQGVRAEGIRLMVLRGTNLSPVVNKPQRSNIQ